MDLSSAFVEVPLIYLAVSDFGVVLGVSVTSGAMASVCGVVSSDELCWAVLLLVLNAGPSRLVAGSMLIVAGLS